MKLPLIVSASPSLFQRVPTPLVSLRGGVWRFEHNLVDTTALIQVQKSLMTDEYEIGLDSELIIDSKHHLYVKIKFLTFGAEPAITINAVLNPEK